MHRALLTVDGVHDQDDPLTGPPGVAFEWRSDLASRPGDDWYATRLRHRRLGPLVLSYEGTPGAVVPSEGHPVVLTLAADLNGIPRELLDRAQAGQAAAHERAVLRLMRTLCDRTDPHYAVWGGDDLIVPTPATLAGTSPRAFYVARRWGGVPIPGARTEEWDHGTFCTATERHRPEVAELTGRLSRRLLRDPY